MKTIVILTLLLLPTLASAQFVLIDFSEKGIIITDTTKFKWNNQWDAFHDKKVIDSSCVLIPFYHIDTTLFKGFSEKVNSTSGIASIINYSYDRIPLQLLSDFYFRPIAVEGDYTHFYHHSRHAYIKRWVERQRILSAKK